MIRRKTAFDAIPDGLPIAAKIGTILGIVVGSILKKTDWGKKQLLKLVLNHYHRINPDLKLRLLKQLDELK